MKLWVWLCTGVLLVGGALAQPVDCPVTQPNQATPPGERFSSYHHGWSPIWTVLWPDGWVRVPLAGQALQGRLVMKWPWWRGSQGELRLEGYRIHPPFHPLEASLPQGYGSVGFQASQLIFAAEGCWLIRAHLGSEVLEIIQWVSPAER